MSTSDGAAILRNCRHDCCLGILEDGEDSNMQRESCFVRCHLRRKSFDPLSLLRLCVREWVHPGLQVIDLHAIPVNLESRPVSLKLDLPRALRRAFRFLSPGHLVAAHLEAANLAPADPPFGISRAYIEPRRQCVLTRVCVVVHVRAGVPSRGEERMICS